MVKLLDCTTRDGGYCTDWNFSDEYIFGLMSELNDNNFCFYEIGYRNYYERNDKGHFYYCTAEFIKKFSDKKNNLKLGVMVDTKRFNETDFPGGSSDCVDFVRIATHPDKILQTLSVAEILHKKNYNVMLQLMDMKNLLTEHFDLLKQWKYKDIAETVYLADTYGEINASELENIYKKMKEIGYKNISFHAHNKNKLALSNSVKAIELGAYSIDVTRDGAGKNGGNLSYKEFFSAYL